MRTHARVTLSQVLEKMTLRLRTISLRAKTVKTLHTFAIHSIASGLSYFFPAEVKEGQAGGKGYASTERTATRTGRIFAGAAGSACAMQWVEVEEACDGQMLSHIELDVCGVCGGKNECVDCGGMLLCA